LSGRPDRGEPIVRRAADRARSGRALGRHRHRRLGSRRDDRSAGGCRV